MTAILAPSALPAPRRSPRLRRRRRAVVAGAAGGLADHLGWDATRTRALFVLAVPLLGSGLLFYAWLWAFAPLEDGEARVTRRAPVSWFLFAIALLATLLALRVTSDVLTWGYVSPLLLLLLPSAAFFATAAGVWSGVLDRADPLRGARHDVAVRAPATILLGAHVVLSLLIGASYDTAWLAVLYALGALLCVAVVWSPNLVTRMRELQTARVAAIRDEHRAEMAAHLHDSVLQTLALIQNRAGASSEAGRLARAQERELRAWLYDGDTPADSDLATDLRDYGSALELDYEVVMTVVSAGTSTERASGEVAAAAREAMLNAARHAGGEVSVYIEGSRSAGSADVVDVFVRDRGPGFDPHEVPADRLGVRESIIGRMRRIGGSATVAPGAGGVGTQIHIRFPAGVARG